MVSSCWKMCTADTIITIATREKTWECLILCHFFFSFFSFQETQFPFHFAPGLSTTCRWDSYLSDRCSSGLLLYYFFLCVPISVYKRGGSSYSFTSTLQEKVSIFLRFFFNTSFFYMCANCCWATGWGAEENLKKNIYIYSLEHCNYRRLYIQPIAN